MIQSRSRAVVAEALGSAFLLAAVVGSGMMGERLAGGNVALALLANTIATGAALATLILMLAPVSGAHLNPAVTLVSAWQGAMPSALVIPYVVAQVGGACLGVVLAHAMFDEPLVMLSTHARSGSAQMLSEFVATFGLLSVIWSVSRRRPDVVAFAVALYITSAYWFTASTSFANPAVTLARSLTNTFSGIRPADVPGFVVAQVAGAISATMMCNWLVPSASQPRSEPVVPS